jgi:hypothetical protein
VAWDLGRPPAPSRDAVMTVTGTVVVSPGTRMPPGMPPPKPPGLPLRPCSARMSTTPLTVDGVSLLVTQFECPPTWTTTAWTRRRRSTFGARSTGRRTPSCCSASCEPFGSLRVPGDERRSRGGQAARDGGSPPGPETVPRSWLQGARCTMKVRPECVGDRGRRDVRPFRAARCSYPVPS